ncbi:MAG TPA: hypothetical protein VF634_09200, partial [Pyrinomonadaceae bacterium]|jgi:hypothetical protein
MKDPTRHAITNQTHAYLICHSASDHTSAELYYARKNCFVGGLVTLLVAPLLPSSSPVKAPHFAGAYSILFSSAIPSARARTPLRRGPCFNLFYELLIVHHRADLTLDVSPETLCRARSRKRNVISIRPQPTRAPVKVFLTDFARLAGRVSLM